MTRECRVKRRSWLRGPSNRRIRRPARGGRGKRQGRTLVSLLKACVRPVLFLGLAAGMAWGGARAYRWLLTSPSFVVRTIRIEGTVRADADDLRYRIGLEPATNIFQIHKSTVDRDVESHPWVKSATVHRELPRTIVVRVTEHEPRAVVLLGHLYLSDANGRLFKRAVLGETEGLVVVTGLDRVTFLEDRYAAEARIREALRLLDRYERPGRPRLSEVAIDPGGGFTLYTYAGATQLRLGKESLDRGLRRLDLVLGALGPDLPRARIIHLDGSARRVAVRLSAEPVPATQTIVAAESMR